MDTMQSSLPPARLLRRAAGADASSRALRQLHEWAVEALWAGEGGAGGNARAYRVALERHYGYVQTLAAQAEAAAHVEACSAASAVLGCESSERRLRSEIARLTDALRVLYSDEQLAATGVIGSHSLLWYRGFLGYEFAAGHSPVEHDVHSLAGTGLGRDVEAVARLAQQAQAHIEAGRGLVEALQARNAAAARLLAAQHAASALLSSRAAFDLVALERGRSADTALEGALAAAESLSGHRSTAEAAAVLEGALQYSEALLGDPYPQEERTSGTRSHAQTSATP